MRLKIIAGNLVAVLAVGLISYAYVRGDIIGNLSSEIDANIANDRTLFDRSWRLSAILFVDHVTDRATTAPVRGAFQGLDDESRRRRAFEAANGVAEWFRDPARGRRGDAPDVVAIIDNSGKVLARNLDPNRMVGRQLLSELPALRDVLEKGVSRHDGWKNEDEKKYLQIGVAPVRNDDGGVIGALLVGYDLSDGLAAAESAILGREVAFVADAKVYSSSLTDTAEVGQLSSFLFGAQKAQTESVLAAQEPTATREWSVPLAGKDYVGITATLSETPSANLAYAVLANRTERLALADSVTFVLVLMLLGAVFTLIYGFVIGGSFLRPVEEIEEGVLTVINGNTDFRLDVQSAEFGGLAFRINQLINVFTGVAEADEDGRVSAAPPSTDTFVNPGGAAAPAPAAAAPAAASNGGSSADEPLDDPTLAKELAAESENDYYERIYQEYIYAKSAAGENVSNIPQDKFTQRMKSNEQALAKKHNCRMVRFAVHAKGDQVVLRPVIIR